MDEDVPGASRWFASGVLGPPDNRMQPTVLYADVRPMFVAIRLSVIPEQDNRDRSVSGNIIFAFFATRVPPGRNGGCCTGRCSRFSRTQGPFIRPCSLACRILNHDGRFLSYFYQAVRSEL